MQMKNAFFLQNMLRNMFSYPLSPLYSGLFGENAAAWMLLVTSYIGC